MKKGVVIGCGARAPAHIEAYNYMDDAEVTACYAPSPVRREPLAEKYGLTAYDDIERMVKIEKPDIVHIITSPHLRVELLTKMHELKVPSVTVEKPIAIGVDDWRALVNLEARTDTKIAICHQFRWYPTLVKCRNALESGALGAVRHLDFSAGMNIAGQGTHILNYAMSLNSDSRVKRIYGNAGRWSGTDGMHDGADNCVAVIEFENGVRGSFVTGDLAKLCGDPEAIYQHVRVSAYAEKGMVNWEEFGVWEIIGPGQNESGDYDADQRITDNVKAQAEFHTAVLEWLEDSSKVPGTDLNQSLHEWKVVLALYSGALGNSPVELSNFDPPDSLINELKKAIAIG